MGVMPDENEKPNLDYIRQQIAKGYALGSGAHCIIATRELELLMQELETWRKQEQKPCVD